MPEQHGPKGENAPLFAAVNKDDGFQGAEGWETRLTTTLRSKCDLPLHSTPLQTTRKLTL
jgi:hypothetical protein